MNEDSVNLRGGKKWYSTCDCTSIGSRSAFHRVYEQPIMAGKEPSATAEEKDIASRRADEVRTYFWSTYYIHSHSVCHGNIWLRCSCRQCYHKRVMHCFLFQLNRLISQFFLRRTQAINHQYLLPKGLFIHAHHSTHTRSYSILLIFSSLDSVLV